MAEDSGQSVLSTLESHVLPLIPGLTDRLATGSGAGRRLRQRPDHDRLAELYPNSRFTGIDLSREAIGRARAEASQKGLRNIEFIVRDLTGFDATAKPEEYDLVTTFDAVHDQARPLDVLKGIHRALKADGWYLMQDIRGRATCIKTSATRSGHSSTPSRPCTA